jgi:hypothetical protein
MVVNNAVLGVTLPIGVFCRPPEAVSDPELALNVNFEVETFGV